MSQSKRTSPDLQRFLAEVRDTGPSSSGLQTAGRETPAVHLYLTSSTVPVSPEILILQRA